MKVLQTVNLGKTQGGKLSNIRYTVYDTLGSQSVAATNTGIYELAVFASEEIKIDQKMARYIHTGRWKIDKEENQMIFYQDDNSTEIAKYNLLDETGAGSTSKIFERLLVSTGSV